MKRMRGGGGGASVEDESCDWRALALGIGALLAQMPEEPEGMLDVVARQLKAPVATLRAHAERLQTQVEGQTESDAAREVAVRIVEQADIMAQWVGAILDVQRIRLGKLPMELRPVDFVQVARACATNFHDAARGVTVHFVPGGVAVGSVLADRSRLARVLDSVLASTAEHSAAAAIELRTSVRGWADGRPRAILTVHDTGRDLESDDLRWMLGSQAVLDVELYVAREIIRLHGGELWAGQRGREQGSTAIVVLPLDFSHSSHTVLARGAAYSPRYADDRSR
jgi:signal transduction histidine kinase